VKSTHEISIEMAADVVRLTQDMQRAQSIVDRGMQGMAKSADIAIKALGALGVTLSLGAIVGMVRDLGRVSNEITNMSRAAGLGVEQFQVLAFGAERFGVSQEKLADIVKDTQDKIGDFVQTGGGAMADFFENIAPRVGVTVEQFRALNGADALQLYVSSLEKANLSQADMVFYMEAIASDSTLLLPLLQDGGKALAEYGDSALRMGKILDQEAVEAARNFDNAMKDVSDSVDGVRSQMVAGLAPAMSEVALEIAGLIQDVPELVDRLSPFLAGGAIVGGFLALNAAMNLVAVTATTKLLPALVAFGPAVGTILAAAAAIGYIDSASKKAQEPIERLNRLLQTQTELQKKVDENGANARGSNFGVPEIETYGERLRIVNANIANTRKEIEGVADSKAWDDLQVELTLMAAGWDNVGDSFSRGKKSAAELSAENKRNAEIAKAVTNQLNLLAKAQEEANAARAATLKTEIESTVKIQEQVAELRDQTAAYGQNEKGLRRLELAKIDDQIATIEMRIAMAEFGAANRELIPVYQAQVQALRDLKAAKEGYFDKKAVVDQAATVQESFNKIFADISTGLTDALIRGFDNGKGLVESFFDYIKNYAKSLLVKIPVQYITSGIGGFLGVAGAGTANAAEMGAFGGLGDAATSFLSDPIGSIQSAVGLFTGGLAASSTTFANAAVIGAVKLGEFIGLTEAATGALASFGASVGAAVPYVGAALAIDNLLFGGKITGAIGKVLGFGGGGGRNAFGTFDTRTGMNVGTEARFRGEADYDGTIATFGQAFEAQYRQIVETLGGLPGDIASYIRVKTDVGGDSPSDAYFSTYIDGQLVAALGRGGIGRSSEELQAALEDYAKRNLVAALANSNLDVEFRSLFASVNVATASIRELEAVLETANKLIEAQARFTALFGTDTEKLALAQKNLNMQFLQLGQQMPSNIDQFKALILAQDRTTDSGRETYLGLLDLAEQFAQLVNAQQQLQAAFDNTKTKTEQYLAILGGQTQTTLQQVANQMVVLNNKLASTTDPSQRIALESQLSDLIFQRYQAEVEMLGAVLAKTQELFAGIEAERLSVSNARATISGTGPGVMTAAQIQAEIAQASVLGSLPTLNTTLADSLQNQANGLAGQADALQVKRISEQAAIAVKQQQAQEKATTAQQAYAKKLAELQAVLPELTDNVPGRFFGSFFEELSNGMQRYVAKYNLDFFTGREVNLVNTLVGGSTGTNALGAALAKAINEQRKADALTPATSAEQIQKLRDQALAKEQAAEQARIKAQEEFAEAIQNYVLDAGKAVSRLSRLREETVKYYEAQDRLAQLMGTSADGLRGTVQAIRFGDMNAVQQLQSLQGDFAQAFASAQASSGESLAGYGTRLNSLIDPILQKAAEVYASGPQFQAIKEAILSQALTVADRLESLQPKNYQMESLGLLDTIDTTLELIEVNTKSAEALIVAAINDSKTATSVRLEAVLAAIQGNPIPGFANGGMFGGGIRMVGERGPEIELTGASRIIPNNRLNDMFRPFDTRGIEDRLDMIARDTSAQVRVLSAGMLQQSKQIDMLIDENRALRKKLATMEPASR